MTRTNDFSQNSDGPIGTAFTNAEGGQRYASACLVSFPTADPVAEMTTDEFIAALFG